MPEVGYQSIRDVGAGTRQADQRPAESEPWRWPPIPDHGRFRQLGCKRANLPAGQFKKADEAVADGAGDENDIARSRAVPPQLATRFDGAQGSDRQREWTGSRNGIAAQQGDAKSEPASRRGQR